MKTYMDIEFCSNQNEEINDENKQIGLMRSFSYREMRMFFGDETNIQIRDEFINTFKFFSKLNDGKMDVTKKIPSVHELKSMSKQITYGPIFSFLFHDNHYVGSFRVLYSDKITVPKSKIHDIGNYCEIILLVVNSEYRRKKVAQNMIKRFISINPTKKIIIKINNLESENSEIVYKLFSKLKFVISKDLSTDKELIMIHSLS